MRIHIMRSERYKANVSESSPSNARLILRFIFYLFVFCILNIFKLNCICIPLYIFESNGEDEMWEYLEQFQFKGTL